MKTIALLFSLILLVGCSQNSEEAFPKPAEEKETKIDDGGAGIEYFNPKADILFVVDNSGSMGTHQNNLARNIERFTQAFFQNSILDYNIAVVTTDMSGGYNTVCCGKFVGPVRVINKQTPNGNALLANNLRVGTNGAAREASFDPVYTALQPALLADWNQGFLRDDAAIIVVFITDAEDQSSYSTSASLYSFLLNLKGGDKRKILGYGAIVPSADNYCSRDDSARPFKIEMFLNTVSNAGNNVLNLCDPGFGDALANFALEIVTKISTTIYLTSAPQESTIRVYFGDYELPQDPVKGWSYSRSMNAIILGKEIDWASQPEGSKLKVTYDKARESRKKRNANP